MPTHRRSSASRRPAASVPWGRRSCPRSPTRPASARCSCGARPPSCRRSSRRSSWAVGSAPGRSGSRGARSSAPSPRSPASSCAPGMDPGASALGPPPRRSPPAPCSTARNPHRSSTRPDRPDCATCTREQSGGGPARGCRGRHRPLGFLHNQPTQEQERMPETSAGDTAWVLMSAALVMLMTPGLALFYGGLVRRKNVLSTIMHSFFILALVSVTWVLWGYTLAFGPDTGLGLIGGLNWVGLEGVTGEPSETYAPTVPHLAFMAFQMMFAIITPALISGAFAERKRFKAMAIFRFLWGTLVYAPVAHWVWGVGGWLREYGALDFAGGTVVHITAGVAALVAASMLGKRIGFGSDSLEPHNLTYTVLGAGLLWFGWFGFNGGSALGANGLAANALVVTNTAAAMGGLAWMTASWLRHGHPSVLGLAAGGPAWGAGPN